MRIKSSAIALLLLLAGAVGLSAQQRAGQPQGRWSLINASIRTDWYDIVPSGADVALQYRLSPLEAAPITFLEVDLGGGFDLTPFFRQPDGAPLTGSYTTAQVDYQQVEALAALGLRQGLSYDAALGKNLVEAFAYYRFHFDHNFDQSPDQLLFQTAFPDRVQILSNSLLVGADYNTTSYDYLHKVWSGIYAEASAEWAPSFFLNSVGDSDYLRLNATAKLFQPIYKSDIAGRMNRFSIYLGDYASADWATGSSIPLFVMQSFGGRIIRDGLGRAVRGFEEGGWDTNLKVMNSFEVRATGHAQFLPSIVPGVFVFFDSGYYGGGYARSPQPVAGNLLASVGVGGYLVTLDLVNITVYLAFPVYGSRIDGAPFAVSSFFHLHF